ncbi:hypothetical protein AHAS_Ahas13G0444900 [Arachis hypogaea]
MRTNPGSTTQILVDRPSITHQPRFMRMYMCLNSVKQGFLASCRPIIGVDGCHLKGDHGQQLLVAVGRDPNDNYFLIVVAAVEAETRDSWGWFINLLLDDIGDVSRRKWVFMSDQQKVSICYLNLVKLNFYYGDLSCKIVSCFIILVKMWLQFSIAL